MVDAQISMAQTGQNLHLTARDGAVEQFGRIQEALHALESCQNRNARWYAVSAVIQERMGNRKNALEALEQAYSLDPSLTILRQILAIHKSAEDEENHRDENLCQVGRVGHDGYGLQHFGVD